MNLDPLTPVIVGVGQSIERPRTEVDPAKRPSPLELMVQAMRGALDDAQCGTKWQFDELIAINSVGWSTADPALLVAEAMDLRVHVTLKTPTGGDVPQRLVHETAQRILAGKITTIGVVGSEAIYTASLARKRGSSTNWVTQAAGVPDASTTQNETVPFNDVEYANGLVWPTEFYPLFENARRARLDWTLDQQRERLGTLWSNFASVAAKNPFGWITNAPSAIEIATPSPTNRMVGFPYTKFLVANLPVDMGAAFIMTNVNEAERLGVPRDQWIFPLAGAHGYDHWYVSERPQLDRSPAMERCWAFLQSTGADPDELTCLDLYSCFPTVVQTAAEVMGIDPFDPNRVPTVTGGLTFGGGPGNNYVTHSIATTVKRLREESGLGLVTGVGWYSTKHAWGLYSSSPPAKGFRSHDVGDEVKVLATCPTRQGDGAITIESYLVAHRHDGEPKKLVVAGRFNDGARVWSRSENLATMILFESEEMIGKRGRVVESEFNF